MTVTIKRKVHVVDDEMINRELLGAILGSEYEVSFAENGIRAIEMLRKPQTDYSLMVLDLFMPELDGFEVIKRCKADSALRQIPIIVATSEKSAEVKSISMGAADFITKPYEMADVILARCCRIIELSEDKTIIKYTEKDSQTGLYTKQYFDQYVRRLVKYINADMDAVELRIDGFSIVMDLYGRQEGFRLLSAVAGLVSRDLAVSRGIACRTADNSIYVYLEHRDNYEEIVRGFQSEVSEKTGLAGIHLRAGIYEHIDNTLHPDVWFERARATCDRVCGRYEKFTERYSRELHELSMYRHRLIGDMQDAIDNHDFMVYYQPKYNIQRDKPVLASAEALIRWKHRELGMLSPGDFIPLFEQNGLIRKIDGFVWREAAAQVACWKKTYGVSVPVIDLADKLIVTIVAVLLYKLVPKRLIAYLNTKSWSRLMVFEKSKKKTGRRFSIKIKVTLLVVLFNTLVAASAIVVCVMQYHNSAVKSYSNEGREAATLIAETIDETKINDFIKNGRAAKGYMETESTLYAISNSSNEIKYIYIYRVEEDGTRVIFDLDTAEVEADEPGTIIPYDDTIKKYRGKILSGEDVPDDITTNDDGWLLSVYEPVKDANGKTLCYIGIDMSMQLLSSEEYSFLAKIISLFLGFLIVIRTYAVWMSELWIIRPLNEITSAASRISYDTPEARRDSAKMLSDLNVSTGDEIEDLYNAYKKTSFDTIRYINEFQKKSGQLTKMQNGLIMVLADMVESRDKCTGDHVRKTAAYTEIILRQMKKEGIYADMLSEEYITEVVNSAPLHDVGKIKIPDAILNKPGRLTDEEFKRIQTHTTAGGEVIDKAIALVDDETGYLTEAKKLATYHHEKWNGKGYPTGLSGEDVPLSARVMAVADVFDALMSRRSHKEPFPFDKAVDIIRNDAGTHFAPVVAKAFLDAEDEIKRVYAINMDIYLS